MAANVSSQDGDLGFQVAPMVDVVFVLLLFFMATVGHRIINEKRLAIQLPGTPTHSQGLTAPLFVDIEANGRVSVNGEVYATEGQRDLSRLSAWLLQIKSEFGSDPVLLRPSSDVRHERIVDVLNACAAAKVKNVSFL